MTENDIKAAISSHFVQLIASRGGFKCSRPEPDNGVDLQVTRVATRIEPGGKKRFFDTGEYVDLQLKCTLEAEIIREDNSLKYDLEAKTYNDLVARQAGFVPLVLVLLVLPNDAGQWVTVTPDELVIRRAAYWYQPAANAQPTPNVATIRVEIPDANSVDLDFLLGRFQEAYQ